MPVKASKSDDIAKSYNHYKIGYQKVATKLIGHISLS